MTQTIKIGLAGMGTVGAGVVKHLSANKALLRERLGVEFEVQKIAVRDTSKMRNVEVKPEVFTTDVLSLLEDPEIQVIVELMGGTELAFELVKGALERGKMVVTANKALLAEHGEEIFKLAAEKKIPVFYEASVAGGIPIIKALRDAFIGNHIRSMVGILNGTCNYILTRMAAEGHNFSDVLVDAQRLGYAEADPTLDVNGWDAGHKAIILASLAYGFWVHSEDVYVEGIEAITAEDICFANELGYTIKHLAMMRADEDGRVEVRVHPALIPQNHVLANVGGVFNAVAVNGDVVGESLFYGRGAGQDPTTSSVLSDLADAARAIASPGLAYGFSPHGLYQRCKNVEEIVTQFYMRLSVVNKPGTLAQVATLLGRHSIGISSVIQPESDDHSPIAPLVLMVHDASFGRIRLAVDEISALDCVEGKPSILCVEHLTS